MHEEKQLKKNRFRVMNFKSQKNVLQEKQSNKKPWKFKKSKDVFVEKHLIFKITIAAVTLSLALALSMAEIPIPLMAFGLPAANFELGDTLILLVIPLIGPWFAMVIGFLKPYLHVLIPHHVGHGEIWVSGTLGALSNILVIALYFGLMFSWKKIFKKENLYFKAASIFICCLTVAMFAAFNVNLWAIQALGFHIEGGGCHDHTHSGGHLHSINEFWEKPWTVRAIVIYGVYGGFIFIKYLTTFIVMLFLEKPILRYAERAHYSYHLREKERLSENKNQETLTEENL